MRKRVKNELLALCGLSALALYATRNKRAALLPTLAAGFVLSQKSETTKNFRGHSAIITGGSRGLGLAMARELVEQNANVTLLARDWDELRRAQKALESLNRGLVHIIQCDVTDNAQLQTSIAESAKKFHGLDLLINNAGSIIVGPWESMTQEDFEKQMNLHVYAVINATRFALPYLREYNSGKRIINICSMGGRVAFPHMVPYDTSKFALSGFSQGITAELYDEGISVTTIYPGLIRTGSAIQAIFKGNHEKEFAWFQSADVFPGLSSSAQSIARKIMSAALDRRSELMPFLPAQIRLTVANFFPELVAMTLVFLNRLLPKEQSDQYKTGSESREVFDRSSLTKSLAKKAHAVEDELNQWPAEAPKGMLH